MSLVGRHPGQGGHPAQGEGASSQTPTSDPSPSPSFHVVLRLAEDERTNGRTHIFQEGSDLTLCGRSMETKFKVRPDTDVSTCRYCADAAARVLKLRGRAS